MDAFNNVLESQKMLEATFSRRFIELEAALKAASPHSHPTISSLSKEVSCFKEQALAMLDLLKQQILAIGNMVDAIEMRHRKKFLLFNGIPEETGEDIASVVINICQSELRLPSLSRESILVSYRLGASSNNRPRSVLVRFNSHHLRNLVWTNKKALKGSSVVIMEFLTKQRQSLFIEARKHFGTRKVWTTDGNIFIKLPNGKKERLSSDQQLQALRSQHAPVVAQVNTEAPTTLLATAPAIARAADSALARAAPAAPAPVAAVQSKGVPIGAAKKTEERGRAKRTT